jgi:hypothetical protein
MNAFLHFIINNEIIHRFWESVGSSVIININNKKKYHVSEPRTRTNLRATLLSGAHHAET